MSWLRSAALADGRVVDVRLDPATGTIAEVLDARRGFPRNDTSTSDPATSATSATGATTATTSFERDEHDLEGYVLLPAPAEPHAHLDKALTADRVPNAKGDLRGAIDAWLEYMPNLDVDDIVDRARRAALELVQHGVTAIRTHVNVYPSFGTAGIDALVRVRDELAPYCDLQIVALAGVPLTGDGLGAEFRAVLRDALLTDRRVIVGGCPHLDPSPFEASDVCLDLAMEFARPLDLHTDETLDPSHLELEYLARRVAATEFDLGAAASHCVSLGVQTLDVQRRVADLAATARVAVVTLPQTNLFLQGRDHPTSTPRGLTAIRVLRDAGVVVGAGADNVRDPFNSMGRSDALETAALLVMAGHLLPHEAYAAVSDDARRLMGLPVVRIEAGAPAELVAVRGASLADAMARGDQERMVWHRGNLVAHTQVTRAMRPS